MDVELPDEFCCTVTDHDKEKIKRELLYPVTDLFLSSGNEREDRESVQKINGLLHLAGGDVEWAVDLEVPAIGMTVGGVLSEYMGRPHACPDMVAIVRQFVEERHGSRGVQSGEERRMDEAMAVAGSLPTGVKVTVVDSDSEEEDPHGREAVQELIPEQVVARAPVMPQRRTASTAIAASSSMPQPGRQRSTWIPGKNTVGWISGGRRGSNLTDQCVVVLANAVAVLQEAAVDGRPAAPSTHVKEASTMQLIMELASRLPPCSAEKAAPPCVELVVRLARVSRSTVLRASASAGRLQKTMHKAGRRTPVQHMKRKRESTVQLKTMVRQSLANAVQGRSHAEFTADMARLQLAGVTIGEKYLQRWFTSTVEHVGACAVACAASHLAHRPLPALGIPSDFELFMDPGTIGKVYRSVRSTVNVIGVTISTPWANNGSTAVFVGAPPHSVSKSEETNAFMFFLESCPMALSLDVLRARLAITTTDGAYAVGEDSYHAPSSELLWEIWQAVGSAPKVGWDEFHRWNKVHARSTAKVPVATQFLQLLRDLENVLSFGQGRLIDRQVATMAGEKWLVGKAPGGAREFVYLAGIPDRFLAKWKTYYHGVDLRRVHSEEGRTGHTTAWWVDLGKRLSSARMPVFALCHSAVYAALTPHVLFIQKPGSLPDARVRSHAQAMATLAEIASTLKRVLPWVQVIPMVLPYIGSMADVRTGVHSLVSALIGKHFRGLPSMLAGMLSNNKFHGLGVTLDWPEPSFGNLDVHHACQCMSRRDSDPVLVRHRWHGKRRTMPCWAAADPVRQPSRARDGSRDPQAWFSEVDRESWRMPPKRACRVQRRFVQTAVDITMGIEASLAYIHELGVQVADYIVGDVGVTRDLQLRWQLSARCFSLMHLATGPLDDTAVEAFKQLYSLAMPELRHTMLPAESEWGKISIPMAPPVEQYRIFAGRVRCAWHEEVQGFTDHGRSDRGWVDFQGVMAVPFSCLPPACRDWSRSTPWAVLQRVAEFMSPAFFTERRKMLRPCGRTAVREIVKAAPPESTTRPWQSGAFFAVSIGKVRRLMVVRSAVLQPIDTAMASSIEDDRFFTKGVWVVARHWHRERRRGISTAPAEGWTGVLGRLWDPVQGHMSGTLVDRLQLVASGFKGVGLDEPIVDAVAAAMPCDPFLSGRAKKIRGEESLAPLLARRLQRAPAGWLHTPVGIDCARAAILAKQRPYAWQRSAQLSRAVYDRPNLNTGDVRHLLAFRGRNKPKLVTLAMTARQRKRYQQMGNRERYAVRLALRGKAKDVPQRTKAVAKVTTVMPKPKAKAKVIGRSRGKITAAVERFLASEE